MDRLLILNASPRAPRSNSRIYASLLERYCLRRFLVDNRVLNTVNHRSLCRRIDRIHHLVLVFPLYIDTIPVTLLDFLKALERHRLHYKPTIHMIINCHFLESEQNSIAVRTIKFFCSSNGFPFGSALCIGSGETIMKTPFRYLVRYKIKAFATAILRSKAQELRVSTPLSKSLFIRASSRYWLKLGKEHGNTRNAMERMDIAAPDAPSPTA